MQGPRLHPLLQQLAGEGSWKLKPGSGGGRQPRSWRGWRPRCGPHSCCSPWAPPACLRALPGTPEEDWGAVLGRVVKRKGVCDSAPASLSARRTRYAQELAEVEQTLFVRLKKLSSSCIIGLARLFARRMAAASAVLSHRRLQDVARAIVSLAGAVIAGAADGCSTN